MDHVVPCLSRDYTLHIPKGGPTLRPVEAALPEINSGEHLQTGDTVVLLHLASAVDEVATKDPTTGGGTFFGDHHNSIHSIPNMWGHKRGCFRIP